MLVSELASSPEQAALAGWCGSLSAQPDVVRVTIRGHRAAVVIDTAPSHPDYVYCIEHEGQWREVVSGNGACVGWDDPERFNW